MRRIRAGLLLMLIAAFVLGACQEQEPDPIRIGVLITMSGDDYDDYLLPLEWARDNVNAAGGVAGRKIEFVYGDLAGTCGDQVVTAAEQFAEDENVVAVIGPEWSDQVMEVGDTFELAMKPMVSPEATADQISFDYTGSRYVWRTVEPDMAQMKIQLYLARTVHDATTVALIADNGPYGRTFRNWFGFLAEELGLRTTAVVLTDYQFCYADVDDALVGQPDVLIAVPRVVADAICTIQALKVSSPETRVIFADGARFPALIEALPNDLDRLEGTAPAPDPDGGYAEAYQARFGSAPGAFSANIYDAVLLIAYGLERSEGATGSDLADAMRDVVRGRGQRVGWNSEGVAEGLRFIREATSLDDLPDITGASGPLEYDHEYWVDPQATTYAHWRVQDGQFVNVDYYTTSDATGSVDSVFHALAGDEFQSDLTAGESIPVPDQTGSWAVIVAASRYWSNYRHQADALAQYDLLKRNGMPDDRIILIMQDDLVEHVSNLLPGTVRNDIGGPNLHASLNASSIDYTLSELSPEDIMDIISGRRTDGRPTVDSTATDNIYLFWVGHGSHSGLAVDGVVSDEATCDKCVSPWLLGKTVKDMSDDQRFRRFLIVIESCHSGAMGEELELREIPSVFMMTGARRSEPSMATNYDPEVDTFVSDKFAFEFWKIADTHPEYDLKSTYVHLYSQVMGSHVSAYNAASFGETSAITLDEFITYPPQP